MSGLSSPFRRANWSLIHWLHDRLAALEKAREAQQKEHLVSQLRHCGYGAGFYGRLFLTGAGNVTIGNNVHIGDNAFIRGEGGLEIGDNTHISRNLVLYTINHRYDGKRLPYDEEMVAEPVRIGRNVWIGMNVCIAPGTTIGNGAIIAMGSVVSGEIPPLAIVGNQKWRFLGHRDQEHYRDRDEKGAYGGPDGVPFLSEQAEPRE